QKDPHTYLEIETSHGTFKVMLYNSTPKHKENFIKLANEGFYEGTLFHRVMKNFMIQGGDPDSKTAVPGQRLGMGGPGYKIDAEIGAPHLRGALAAARDGNPDMKSSGSQFYVVQGKKWSDQQLDQVEKQKGLKYNPEQRKLYKEIGGAPFLDGEYTVFGEVVEGMEVVDKIAEEPVDQFNRPLKDVVIKHVRVVN
ncbi:MAG: peptidylprolyl isomerase, partial [Bacteroidetes bacterium]